MSSRVAQQVDVPMVEVLDYEGKEYLKLNVQLKKLLRTAGGEG